MSTHPQSLHQVMDALGHQTRREILDLLKVNPMPVGEIANHLPISRPAVSKHLRQLEKVGLVTHISSGASNIFRLNEVGFQQARAYLDDFWHEALDNFQQLVETQQK